jgi:hypothetical protein
MHLKIQRSQRSSFTNTIIFCLDIRADYTAEEQSNIQKYKLGAESIYNSRAAQKHLEAASGHLDQTQAGSTGQRLGGLMKGVASMALAKMQLSVTIASLAKGHHIECKDMEELLEAEDTLRTACKNLTRYLEVANTFNGSEIVVSYENGEEKVQVTENAPPLIEQVAPALLEETRTPVAPSRDEELSRGPSDDGLPEFGEAIVKGFKKGWIALEERIVAAASSKGWNISQGVARTGMIVVIILVLYILLRILL